jgi:hypothetical protein
MGNANALISVVTMKLKTPVLVAVLRSVLVCGNIHQAKMAAYVRMGVVQVRF